MLENLWSHGIVDQISDKMIRQEVTVDQYENISKTHEYYLWNFINNDVQGPLEIFSYFIDFSVHPLRDILNIIDIPYFESKTSESYDFLINLGFRAHGNVWKNGYFHPVCLAFNKRRKVTSTWDGHCYCPSGIIDMIGELNPEFLLNAKIN